MKRRSLTPSNESPHHIGYRNPDTEATTVSIRVHGKGNLGAKPRNEVMADILQSIQERRT